MDDTYPIQDEGVGHRLIYHMESQFFPPLDGLSRDCVVLVQLVATVYATHIFIVQDDCGRKSHMLACSAIYPVGQSECCFMHC